MEAYINKPKDLSESEINDAVEKAYNSLARMNKLRSICSSMRCGAN